MAPWASAVRILAPRPTIRGMATAATIFITSTGGDRARRFQRDAGPCCDNAAVCYTIETSPAGVGGAPLGVEVGVSSGTGYPVQSTSTMYSSCPVEIDEFRRAF
eukprot:COSAG01_NODE_7607_length_3129_cov_1.646205_1_plen_104_part_00